ncbi:MAG TPA: hypothetical protein ENN19_02115 [Chloroflexi bacterium]|nr:hypothetical protein [Chloroflexota bacterium]
MWENTYTYTARNARRPEEIVTFTLHDHKLSIGVGSPLEHIERAVEARQDEETDYPIQSWLKPMALSLIERATSPFDVSDVIADVAEDILHVRAWYRVGGLRLSSITLVHGAVDNPAAAKAFAMELERRRADQSALDKILDVMDYWVTWFVAGFVMVFLLQIWRRRNS